MDNNQNNFNNENSNMGMNPNMNQNMEMNNPNMMNNMNGYNPNMMNQNMGMQGQMPQNNMMNQMPQNNMMNQNMGMNPNMMNQNMNNNMNNQNSDLMTKVKDNKKIVYIVGAVIGVIILAFIISAVAKKIRTNRMVKDFEESKQEEVKTEERLNQNYEVKGYKTKYGEILLVEFKNKNKEAVRATIKTELLDASGNTVEVLTDYIFDVAGNSTSYAAQGIYGKNFADFKITAKLELEDYIVTYNDKVEIVSKDVRDGNCIVQVKNNSTARIEGIEVGLLFKKNNGDIVYYDDVTFSKVGPSETSSESVRIPRDYDKGLDVYIDYDTIEAVIIAAASSTI